MSANYLLGLDLGSGSVRCLLIDQKSGQVITACRSYAPLSALIGGAWAFDLDITGVWRLVGDVVQEALRRAGALPQDVAGIAATSMRHSLVVLDKQGNTLLASPNKDARAANQGTQLAMDRGPELYRRTGHYPAPIFIASRLLWLKENQSQVFKAAHAALSLSDWVGYKLTGVLAAEFSQAAESLLFDLQTRTWAGDLLQSLGLPANLFPPLRQAGDLLGTLTEDSATHLGLRPGIPVGVGGADTQSGLLGAGVVSSGQVGILAGTTTPIQLVTEKPIFDPEMRTWAGLHLIPGLYVLESNAGAMGSALEWVAHLLYAGSHNPPAMLCAEAQSAPPGAGGVFSSIGASVFNAAEMSLPVDNLSFSSVNIPRGEQGRAAVARATLEGMAYAVRANLDQIRQVLAQPIREAWLTGGMSRSELWAQVISDVTGCTLHVSPTPEATALGAAICAGVGAGLYPDLAVGAKYLVGKAQEHQPGAASPIYKSLYTDWQALQQAHLEADLVAAGQMIEAMGAEGETLPQGEALPRPSQGEAAFRPRIYVSADVDELTIQRLQHMGEVTFASYREGRMLVGEDLVETLNGYHCFITEVDLVSAEDLQKLPDLRFIAVCRGNPVNVDVQASTAAGVLVMNTPARNADAVADLAVAFMLMLARKLPGALAFIREPDAEAGDLGRMGMAHEQFLGHELWHKTAGIIGGGAIGRKVIQRLLPYGMRLLLYDPYLSSDQVILMGAEKVSLEKLLEESDFISLHAPVTDETRAMIDAPAFERMKDGAMLINTARAALVDNAALLDALRSGKLGGAALDVFPVEPPGADDPLLALPNVIATPHLGGNTAEVAAHQGAMVADALELLLAGKKPDYLLNPSVVRDFRWTGERKVAVEALQRLAAAPGPGATDLDVEAQKRKEEETLPPPKKGGLLSSLKKVVTSLTGEKMMETPSGKSPLQAVPSSAPAASERAMPAASGMATASVVVDSTHKTMLRILETFTANVRRDAGMAAFAEGKNVTFQFTIKDLGAAGQSFFLSFVGGKVDAGLGDAPISPDVRLKMSADTLDGMFTGRINAARAAMSGKLSFSGDTGKAMAFQRIQREMGHLYTAARQEIGDPGDLTTLGSAPQPVAAVAATPSQPLQAPVVVKATQEASLRVGDVRDDILQVTSELYARGLITPTGGNISARCDDNPEEIWITPSAIFKGDLRPAMMVRIDLEGNVVRETDYSASSERRVHCAIYKRRPDVQAIVHSHAPQATLMALTGTKFLPISTEAAFLGEIPVVPFIMPGTDELGESVAQALGAGVAVLMQNHGLVVVGSSLRRAADMSDVVEVTAHKILTCKMLGIDPPLLPEEVVKTLREVGGMMA